MLFFFTNKPIVAYDEKWVSIFMFNYMKNKASLELLVLFQLLHHLLVIINEKCLFLALTVGH